MNKYTLTVREVQPAGADSILIVFENALAPITYRSGQFLTLVMRLAGQEIRRSYSLCSAPNVDSHMAVSVKRVEGGLVSNLLNDSLQAGDTLEVLSPMGTFTPDIQPDTALHFVFWAAGSGITPLMSMLKSILTQAPASRITLVYQNRYWDNIIFREELAEWQARYPERLQVLHCLSQPYEAWEGYRGRLNADMIGKIQSKIPQDLPQSHWLCGPEEMMDCIGDTLQTLNIAPAQIHRESFYSSKSTEVPSEVAEGLKERQVEVHYDGAVYTFPVAPQQTILDAAMAKDIDLPYSCQSGLCTACLGRCTSGEVKMTEDDCLTDQEMRDGYVLTCVAHPLSEGVVIHID